MDRVLVNTAFTLAHTFQIDGVGTDPAPDTATVGITRADGTVLVAAGTAATQGAVPGQFTYQVNAAANDRLDTLTATWTSNLGSIVATVEVAGAFLFSIADARTVKPLDNATVYPASRVVEMRTLVEQALEAALGYALVPRYARETFTPDGGTAIWSRVPLVGNVPGTGIPFATTIRSASIDGTAVGVLADIVPDDVGFYYPAGWGAVRRGVTIGFEHGAQYPPEPARREALKLARYYLTSTSSPIDDRATSMTSEDVTYSLVTPGRRGEMFPLASTNAFVDQYNLNVGVA